MSEKLSEKIDELEQAVAAEEIRIDAVLADLQTEVDRIKNGIDVEAGARLQGIVDKIVAFHAVDAPAPTE
jgi:hypothetical protein